MNIGLEVRPTHPSSVGVMKGPNRTSRSSRRLSLPDYSSLIIPMKKSLKESKKVESPSKKHPYEFEKLRRAPHDTPEDMATVLAFKPKREYLPSQRRSSMPTTKMEKFRFHGHSQLKLARRSLAMHVAPPRKSEEGALTAFERQRQKQQREEGALYATTRATEKATLSWKRKTIVLGPLGLVTEQEEEERKALQKQQRRESLLALLEKDASKHNVSVSSVPSLDLSVSSGSIHSPDSPEASGDNDTYKLPYQISPRAVKEQQLREVFQKQNAAAKRKSQAEKKERNIIEATNASKAASKKVVEKAKEEEPEAKSGSKQKKEKNAKETLRKHQFRRLKVSLKEAAKSDEPALMTLVTMESTKLARPLSKKNRRQSMPDMSEKPVQKVDKAKDATKTDRRSHLTRRSSAPEISSPGEAPKDGLPKHMLADIITTAERDGVSAVDTADKKKKNGKKKKGNRRSSMPDISADAPLSPSGSKNGKSKKKKKGSRHASMPDLSGGDYDWAMAAKKQTASNEWKHIKSDENAVRRSPEEKILPLEPSNEISNTNCLPKLEALLPLLPLVEPKLRGEVNV